MKLLSCTGCKFAGDCDHARHLRASLKGHGIRSVKFACAKRENVLSPGQAAIFTTFTSTGDDMDNVMPVSYPGVVIEQMGSKVLGFIRPEAIDTKGIYPFEPKGNGYVKMPLARVRADDTRPPVELRGCRWCGSYYEIDGNCGRNLNYTPNGHCRASLQDEG